VTHARREGESQGQDMFRLETRVDRLNSHKASNQQTGTGQKHYRESEFHADQHGPRARER
jgi:hypothetical protein